MSTTVSSGPTTRPGPTVPLAVIAATAITLVFVSAGSYFDLPAAPWPLQALFWTLLSLLRAERLQLWAGAGDLTGRTALRVVVASVIVTNALAASGALVLIPLGCMLIVSVHLQWVSTRAVGAGMLSSVVLSALAVVLVATGYVDSAIAPVPLAGLLVMGNLLAQLMAWNLLLAAQDRDRILQRLAHLEQDR